MREFLDATERDDDVNVTAELRDLMDLKPGDTYVWDDDDTVHQVYGIDVRMAPVDRDSLTVTDGQSSEAWGVPIADVFRAWLRNELTVLEE